MAEILPVHSTKLAYSIEQCNERFDWPSRLIFRVSYWMLDPGMKSERRQSGRYPNKGVARHTFLVMNSERFPLKRRWCQSLS